MKNGRCRLHGGKSTGPRTEEGRKRCKMARWKHGYYSAEAIEFRRLLRVFFGGARELAEDMDEAY